MLYCAYAIRMKQRAWRVTHMAAWTCDQHAKLDMKDLRNLRSNFVQTTHYLHTHTSVCCTVLCRADSMSRACKACTEPNLDGILFTLPVQPSSYGVALLFQKPKLWVQARYRRQRFCSFPHVESPARLIQELSQAKTTLAELPF